MVSRNKISQLFQRQHHNKRSYVSAIALFCFISLLAMQPGHVQASGVVKSGTISITATVEEDIPDILVATVIISGFAYPGTDVTIKQNGEIISTAPADSAGTFSTTIENIEPGIYTYAIRGEDSEGRQGPASNVTVSVSAGVTTAISGVYLGPTFDVTDRQITLDEVTILQGITAVDSDVTLYVTAANDRQTTYNKQANQQGIYLKSILGSSLGEGRYTAHSRAVATDGTISDTSKTVTLRVSPTEDTSECADSLDSDINCDQAVDLVDFSILLFWWNRTNPDNARADINGDRFVDIIDFSIMLFYWTA